MFLLSAGCSFSFIGAFFAALVGKLDLSFGLIAFSAFCGLLLFMFVFGVMYREKSEGRDNWK